MNKIHEQQTTVNCFGKDYKVKLILEHYSDGNRPAIYVDYLDEDLDEQLPFGCLTVNIPEVPLEPNQCFVKTWSENEEWAMDLINKVGCFDKLALISCGYTYGVKMQLKEGWTWE
jgi:hypothetical protein